jgi:hypothetical protein
MTHYQDDPQMTYNVVDMGALTEPQYFWWKDSSFEQDPPLGTTSETKPLKDWCLRVTAVNPEDPDDEDETGKFPPIVTDIRHETVVKAIDGILAGAFSDKGRLPAGTMPVDESTVECCQKLVDDPEYGDLSWDPWVCDELLQVIVYGGIVF